MTGLAAIRPDSLRHILSSAIRRLEALPWTVLALPMRLAGFAVFWRAGMAKLDSWPTTILLFREEYKVPLLPPEVAAYLATSVELACALLLLIGLLTRLSALALLGLTAVIQIFVYPESWPSHVQWLAFLLPLLARGPGALSLDRLLVRHLRP
ncbi:MAG: DoxX family membrane protein [Alphaproteobacteria bacterium]|nr:DoxX family membrane protein [Alphaproteobacteria bacterium]